MIGRSLIAGLMFWPLLASAQTVWPVYMASLEPETSASPVTAVLPADAAVQLPDAGLPAAKARWSGKWSGWACQARVCDVKLVVEHVNDEGATVVYAGGSAAQGQLAERLAASFTNAELHGTRASGTRLIFRMRPDDSVIEFLALRSDGQSAAGVLARDGSGPKGTVERIPTPFVEDGKPIGLEVVIFKPEGTGPFPLLLVNHGSTGEGNNPQLFTSTWTSPALAKFFTDKGWLVAFPQRRGRGNSQGIYDEGFRRDRSGYACEPELSLAGFERALADVDVAATYLLAKPEVNAARSVIAGVSRGGILAVSYAGLHPARFAGVINFVGGWIGDRCRAADDINTPSFQRGAAFRGTQLWLYGENDPFYTIDHSRKNFDAFIAAGGQGSFTAYTPAAGQSGHGIHAQPAFWRDAVNGYLDELGRP